MVRERRNEYGKLEVVVLFLLRIDVGEKNALRFLTLVFYVLKLRRQEYVVVESASISLQ